MISGSGWPAQEYFTDWTCPSSQRDHLYRQSRRRVDCLHLAGQAAVSASPWQRHGLLAGPDPIPDSGEPAFYPLGQRIGWKGI